MNNESLHSLLGRMESSNIGIVTRKGIEDAAGAWDELSSMFERAPQIPSSH